MSEYEVTTTIVATRREGIATGKEIVETQTFVMKDLMTEAKLTVMVSANTPTVEESA